MPNAQDAFWFKSQFQPQIEAAIAGTPFSVDMITAVACQETGGIWPRLRRQGLPTARILELCVGDTIDASPTGGGRRAFPQNKAELKNRIAVGNTVVDHELVIRAPGGEQFEIIAIYTFKDGLISRVDFAK